ncbi:MAG: hypothetical protein ACRDP6_25270 [Actinoallomurus sp.]
MHRELMRICRDVRSGRQLEAYVAAFVSSAFAVMSFFGDLVSTDLRWAICMMGIGLLVYRSTDSAEEAPAPRILLVVDDHRREMDGGETVLISLRLVADR